MNVVFRADASVVMGTGHVSRCLTLAKLLQQRGSRCAFICANLPGNMAERIKSLGFSVILLDRHRPASELSPGYEQWLGATWSADAEQTRLAIQGMAIDWLVVDSYSLDWRWEQELRPHVRKLMAIDDLANRRHECDVLLDQNWFGSEGAQRYSTLVPPYCTPLLGPKYALLSAEYALLRDIFPARDGAIKRALIFMGGSDPANQTRKAVLALSHPDLRDIALDVVVGINHPDPAGLSALVSARPYATLHQGLRTLAGVMARSDLMISGGGATTWERMALGLPSIVLTIADNQLEFNERLMVDGYSSYLGRAEEVEVGQIVAAVKRYLDQPGLAVEQSERSKLLVDGRGADLVAAVLLEGMAD